MTSNHRLSHVRRRLCQALLAPVALAITPAFADEMFGGPMIVKVPVGPGLDRSGKFFGFRFEFTRSTRKGEATEYQRLSIKELPNGELQLHRRNDNGVAGSGVVVNVKYSKEEGPNEVVMSFEQSSASSYQEGLFLKKAIPAFSLKEVLLGGQVSMQFELDSNFSVEATRANFQRMAMLSGSPGGKEMWRVTTPSGQQYLQLQFFPYRNGTKLTVAAVIAARETSAGVIDFGLLVQEVQAAVRAIINA